MKRSILVLFILILSMPISGSVQAGIAKWLRATQMLPDPQEGVKNITQERFRVDSIEVTFNNRGPDVISTSSYKYRRPVKLDPFVEGLIIWRTNHYSIDLLPGKQYTKKFPVIWDHVLKAQFPEKAIWLTGPWNKHHTKRIPIDFQRNLVTTFFNQVIDVTPPGSQAYSSSIFNPFSRQNSRLDIYSPWGAVRISTTVTEGYSVRVSQWKDKRGDEWFKRKITPSVKPLVETSDEAGLCTLILPPGTYLVKIELRAKNNSWYQLTTKRFIVKGNTEVYDGKGRRINQPYIVPRPMNAISTSAVEIE